LSWIFIMHFLFHKTGIVNFLISKGFFLISKKRSIEKTDRKLTNKAKTVIPGVPPGVSMGRIEWQQVVARGERRVSQPGSAGGY